MAGVYTVSKINSYIMNMFKQDFVLRNVSIEGEVSDCKYHSSGHVFLSLKDSDSVISAVIYAGVVKSLKFKIENGQKIVVRGSIETYQKTGKYQVVIYEVSKSGEGEIRKRLLELKQHYEEMGYFADEYKKNIPFFSKRIGVIAAKTGSVIHDIMQVSYRRNPYVELFLFPAIVQGEYAIESVVQGITVLDRMKLDCIIIARGGGSTEDLWTFNEPLVVEAVFNCETPIISAVGHGDNYTICDYVADTRAATPSEAAEKAVFEIDKVEAIINEYNYRIEREMLNKLDKYKELVEKYNLKLQNYYPVNQINERRFYLNQSKDKLNKLMNDKLMDYNNRLKIDISRLEGVSPLIKLGQGYSFTENEYGDNINSIKQINVGEHLLIHFSDGYVDSVVSEVKENG